jgi:hypothetical protein
MDYAKIVRREKFLAALSLLEKRATWRDRWRAKRMREHWLNDARRELLLVKHGLIYSCRHGVKPEPCVECSGKDYSLFVPKGGDARSRN